MEDIIDIIVTETTNLIEITSQPTDEIIDVNIIDNREDITLNVTPSVVEININSLTGNFGVNWGEIAGTLSDQTDLQDALDLKADLVDGKVPSSQLPSYVDDIVEVATYSALPTTGETGKIYVVLDTNLIYRWSGSAYIEIKDSSAVWGAITGTLSSQTDLQNALDAKLSTTTAASTYVPYTGATGDVNLGVNVLKSNNVILDGDTSATGYLGFKQFSGAQGGGLGYSSISATGLTKFYFRAYQTGADVKSFNFDLASLTNLTERNYTLPDANGTLALTSNLTAYVPYTGATEDVNLGTNILKAGKELIGPASSANLTRFPNALAVISNTDSGIQHNESLNIGTMSEAVSSGSTWASGIYGAGYTNSSGTGRGTGVTGEGHVSSATDTGVAVGVRGYANDVHSGNYNIGLYGDAENGSNATYGGNVALFLANGNIVTSSAAAKTWYLGGNITFDGQGSSKVIGVTNGASFALGTVTSGVWNATAIADSYISSASTWNAKQNALSGTGFVKISGTTISYDNSTYLTTSSASSTYLAKTGGTLTGSLNGTSAVFSGAVWGQTGYFSNTTADNALAIFQSNASYHAVTITNSGSGGSALYISGGSTFAGTVNITGVLTAQSGLANGSGQSFTLPSTTGTLALTSQLSSYLPLSGGTLTGALSGTSASLTSTGVYVLSLNNTAQDTRMEWQVNGTQTFQISSSASQVNLYGAANIPMLFYTNGSERLRITSAGNVGIGTTSPSYLIHGTLNSNSATALLGLTNNVNNTFSRTSIALNSNNGAGQIGTVSSTWTADTLINADETYMYGSNGIVIYSNSGFSTRFVTGGSERMRITSAGDLLIGTTSAIGSGISMPDGKYIWSAGTYSNTTANAANMWVGSSGVFGRSTSSLKYKTNVRNYDKGLDIIQQIRPVYYNGKNDGETLFAGLIAEEIHDLGLTEFVQYSEDGTPDALAYTHMVALLIKGIKELKAKIETLENK